MRVTRTGRGWRRASYPPCAAMQALEPPPFGGAVIDLEAVMGSVRDQARRAVQDARDLLRARWPEADARVEDADPPCDPREIIIRATAGADLVVAPARQSCAVGDNEVRGRTERSSHGDYLARARSDRCRAAKSRKGLRRRSIGISWSSACMGLSEIASPRCPVKAPGSESLAGRSCPSSAPATSARYPVIRDEATSAPRPLGTGPQIEQVHGILDR